jgi:nucleotide-binding universal stress UspA family protein
MFKHILVATDGSKLGDKAVSMALKLAAACGNAKVTALMVVPDYSTQEFTEAVFTNGPTPKQMRQRLVAEGERKLDAALAKQASAGHKVERVVTISDYPYDQIVEHAKKQKCDLIVMASRGRGAVKSALLGSQTTHVLSLASVPVLVVR